jgi:hypothetical protein
MGRRLLFRAYQALGSLTIAVPLLIVIAAVLAWGTIYETRFGTAAVQRAVYTSWWFQLLLGFLALNLAVAALQRYPWQRRHLPFLTAHLAIILILLGGIIGGRFGIQGQLIIPEGQADDTLHLFQNILTVRQANPGIERAFPTRFETQAWVHEPHVTFPVAFDGRSVQLTVDRYYPHASAEEVVTGDGAEDNPAIRVRLIHEEHEETVWLFARDPERFGVSWGETHLLFIEPKDAQAMERVVNPALSPRHPRGVVSLAFPALPGTREIPVPESFDCAQDAVPSGAGCAEEQEVEIPGTPYRITFKDYFPDFEMDERGLGSRSASPNNPAVAFTLSGPEGVDPYMLFAFHPEFSSVHGWQFRIPAQVRYTFEGTPSLPADSIALLQAPAGTLVAIFVDAAGARTVIEPLVLGTRYTHPSLGYQVEPVAHYPRAMITRQFTNEGNEVKAEALHLVAREGDERAEAWVRPRETAQLRLGKEPLLVEYGPARRELPVTVKLLDFRKIDYPGLQMAAGFESDVEVADPKRGLILMRRISMNNPLRYRGFSFYQSSYVPGSPEVTILSVRSDPGTPLVYAGFLTVIVGVVAMFILRAKTGPGGAAP